MLRGVEVAACVSRDCFWAGQLAIFIVFRRIHPLRSLQKLAFLDIVRRSQICITPFVFCL